MIRVEYIRKKSNYWELTVCSQVSQSVFYTASEDLSTFKRIFKEGLDSIKRDSVGHPNQHYKIIDVDENYCELWHFDMMGDKDRLVAQITYTK